MKASPQTQSLGKRYDEIGHAAGDQVGRGQAGETGTPCYRPAGAPTTPQTPEL